MDHPLHEENAPHHDEHHEAAAPAGAACRCAHHAVVPVLAIILGLEFFFAEIGVLTWGFVNVTWPLLIVIAGIAALTNRRCACCAAR